MDQPDDDISLPELLYWVERASWMALVMCPIIWWLQGPSVSTDQFVVRTSLIVISAAVAAGFRIRAWWLKRHPPPTPAETN
jgi:hypothetical protein